MALFGYLFLLLGALVIGSFFPGFFFIRRLRWTPLEKLCGSVALSLLLLYLATWASYIFGPQDQRPVYRGILVAAAILGALSWRDATALFRTFRVRQAALAFAALLAFTFALLAMIRVYSGAWWSGDWYEHFQRALFFLDRLPANAKINVLYVIPARPPMQNVLAALFLGAVSDRFELFQAIFAFQNVLLLLPCVLLAPSLGFTRRRRILPVLFLLAANPAVMENITYTWTKSLAAFYVIVAIWFYLAGWRKNDPVRTAAAFLALAAGTLVHYSAGPYLVFMGLHYAVRFLRSRPMRWRELGLAAAPAVLVLATWFGWSFHVYGAKTTLSSNTSVTSAESDANQNLKKIGANLVDTIVPVWMRDGAPDWKQPNPGGALRDEAFVFYQLNLIFAMGVLGGPLVLWLTWRQLVRGGGGGERLFWRLLVPFCIVLGVAVVGERDPLGVPHLTLLAIEAIGITLLAAAFPTFKRPLRAVVIAACCVDFALGVYWQARIESLENTPGQTVFGELTANGGQLRRTDPTPLMLNEKAWQNWLSKHQGELFPRWLRDLPRGHEADPRFQAQWQRIEPELRSAIADHARDWGGWPERHGGEFRYLGDWVGGDSRFGTDAASAIVLLLFAGGVWLMWRERPEFAAVAVPKPPEAAPRKKKARR